MKRTDREELLIKNVATADQAWRDAKRNALERAKEAALAEIDDFRERRDLAVRTAIDGGVKGAWLLQRHTGLHTTDPNTLRAALATTEHTAPAVEGAVEQVSAYLPVTYASVGERVTVTLTDFVLAEACALNDFTVEEAKRHGLDSAEFDVVQHENGHQYLDPISGDFLANLGKRHPVTVWAHKNEATVIEAHTRNTTPAFSH